MSTETWTRSDLAGTNAGLAGPVKMWTPPRPRPYAPKAYDPGQPITWTRHVSGHHAGGKWIPPADTTRTGTIWSAGPPGIRSAWVQPDDAAPGDMVLVHLGSLLEQEWFDAAWQRDTIRRCNAVTTSPGIYAEERERLIDWRGGRSEKYVVRWHCDPHCDAVEHAFDLRLANGYEPTRGDVIHSLLSRQMRNDFCQRCIWLNEPAEVAS